MSLFWMTNVNVISVSLIAIGLKSVSKKDISMLLSIPPLTLHKDGSKGLITIILPKEAFNGILKNTFDGMEYSLLIKLQHKTILLIVLIFGHTLLK